MVQNHDRPKKNMSFALVWLASVQKVSKILHQVSLLYEFMKELNFYWSQISKMCDTTCLEVMSQNNDLECDTFIL